jgi:prepilin-type N-terminal cleavage/methylation domain-containing protein
MQLMKISLQRGFNMIEVMIGLALTGIVLAGALTMTMRADDQTAGRNKADALVSFQQLAAQYFIANRTDIEAAMAGDGAMAAIHCRLNVAADGSGGLVTANSTKHTCTFDGTLLRAKGVWPSGMSVNSVDNGRYIAIARQIISTDAVPIPTGADEMLIVHAPLANGDVMTSGTVTFSGDAKRAIEEIQASMAAMGGSGGYVPPGADYGSCQYNATTKQVCGTGWAVSLSDFID